MSEDASPRLLYHNKGGFLKALKELRMSGGPKQQAAEQVSQIIGDFSTEGKTLKKLTHYGEGRIPHCVKYDLRGDCRLVTVQDKGQVWLLFVGDHVDTEHWLDAHRGLTMAAGKSKQIQPVIVTSYQHSTRPSLGVQATSDERPLLLRFDFPELEQIVPQSFLRKQLLAVSEETDDTTLMEVIECLPDSKLQLLFIDLFHHLGRGELDAAKNRLDLHFERGVDVVEVPSRLADALESGENSELVTDLTALSSEERTRLLSDDFEPWLLWLHPDQKRVVEEDYDVPAFLKGVSGSGKTVILIHRARRLAHKYPGETIGILTLNRSLARLIENLLKKLCLNGEEQQIKVEAFYDYFKRLLNHIGAENYLREYIRDLSSDHPMQATLSQAIAHHKELANEFSPQSGETLDDTWSEFWRIPEDDFAELRNDVVRTLMGYGAFDVEAYLRDEFTLIRSAFSRDKRAANVGEGESYLEYPRKGRCIGFPEPVRRKVLKLLRRYEEYMLAGAMMDELALSQALIPSRTMLKELPDSLRRRCLLIDEFQDFSTLELSLLKQIPTASENGFFMAGDTVQKVMVKDFNLGAAYLDRHLTRNRTITKNYRNSRQILVAAHAMVTHYGDLAAKSGESIDVLNPEYAVRETAQPRCIEAAHPLDVAWHSAIEWLDGDTRKPWAVCLVTANPHKLSPDDILNARPQGVAAKKLSGDYLLEPDSMVVGTLSEVKGFEFSLIVIVGCDSAALPDSGLPKDEQWRDALRLYVAMTRGRDQVVLVYQGTPSPFLDLMRAHVSWQTDGYSYSGPRAEPAAKPDKRGSKFILTRPKPEKRIVVPPPPITTLSVHSKNALLFYFEAHVYSSLRTNRPMRAAFEVWVQNPANLHQLRISRLFSGRVVRRDLANEIDAFLRPHRLSLIWDC
jgi:superfamily I DNA/RNA helicase